MKAQVADPRTMPDPGERRRGSVRLQAVRFEEHVERAIASLPDDLRAAIRNVEITVEDEHPG